MTFTKSDYVLTLLISILISIVHNFDDHGMYDLYIYKEVEHIKMLKLRGITFILNCHMLIWCTYRSLYIDYPIRYKP